MALILFVDDNRETLELLELATRLGLHQAISSFTVEQGLAATLARHPDLVFVDFNLASSSAEQFILKLKQEASVSSIPVLVLSAGITDEQADQVITAGAKNCLQKPLSLDDLAHTITWYTRP